MDCSDLVTVCPTRLCMTCWWGDSSTAWKQGD